MTLLPNPDPFLRDIPPCAASPLHLALDDEWRARMATLRAPNSASAAAKYREAQVNTSRIETQNAKRA